MRFAHLAGQLFLKDRCKRLCFNITFICSNCKYRNKHQPKAEIKKEIFLLFLYLEAISKLLKIVKASSSSI